MITWEDGGVIEGLIINEFADEFVLPISHREHDIISNRIRGWMDAQRS